jgi:hypothetical protein
VPLQRSKPTRCAIFDQLVGAGEQDRRDDQRWRIGGLEVCLGGRPQAWDACGWPAGAAYCYFQAVTFPGVPYLGSHSCALQPPAAPRVTWFPIILVHGTWGRGFFLKSQDEGSSENAPSKGARRGARRWFEKGSEFREKLEEQLKSMSLEYSVYPFHWSGANSVFARDRAGTELADKLKAHLQDRSATPVIIAHSHGGNVALRALSHLGDANRVRVVTLATPFLRVFVRDPPKLDPLVWILLWAAVALIVAVLTVAVVAAMLSATKGLAGTSMSERLTFWALVGGLVAAALGSTFILRWLHGIFINPQSKSPTGGSLAHDIQEAAFFPSIDASGPRMLVIRGVDDEASLTLAAGSIGSRLSSLVLFIVIPIVYVFGVALFALLDWSGVWKDQSELLFLVVAYGCAFGALLCLFLPGICKSAFGREFLTTAFVCETAADSAPDSSARIDSVTLSPVQAGQRLRHYIYEHPKCVDEIVRWVRGVMQNADNDARSRASVSNLGEG